MQRRAVVIKTYGDAEIGAALQSGITTALTALNAQELQAVKAENERLKAEKGVRQNGDNIRWGDVAEGLSEQYRIKQHGKLYNAILIGWAVIWMEIFGWYDFFSAWNREA